MLTKEVKIDHIGITETGVIEVREATIISEDGVELSRTFHRHVLAPGDDLTGEDPLIIKHAQVAWTQEVVASHQKTK